MAAPPGARPGMLKIFFVSCMGTTLEYYDFLIYGTAASLVFNKLFFPADDPLVGTLLAFAAFGTGFLARPLGGILAGHWGDRVGRRRMLILTLTTMGLSTMAVGLLPTYAVIGVWAPVLLVVLRLVQGLAAGGEWGGAALYGVESAPPDRRAFYGSFTGAGISIGGLLAIAVFAAMNALFPDAMLTWGWRIPFLLGGLLIVVGLVARQGADDVPRQADSGAPPAVPLVTVVRHHPRALLLTFGLSLGYNAIAYIGFSFFLTYAVAVGHSTGESLGAQAVFLTGATIFSLVSGALADRFGRRPVVLVGAVLTGVYLFAFFWLVKNGNPVLFHLAFALASPLTASMKGATPAMIAEQFPATVRYSGASLGYQLGAALGGGLAPTVATLVFVSSGRATWSVPLLGLAVAALVAVCVLGLPETLRRPVAANDERTPQEAWR
ncbi:MULTISPECIES: MFS transporter [Streptomyces]|uniref:MFS transporter n=1 Tax=Streptomyces TaxID=1883 RepID=UPI000766FD04|nr:MULTISPECIES: MFS transporter [Streptomyces]MBW8087302.1 MFS transporter [Streptomyces hygroscopicus subsp. hygroscopicus]MCO8303431.1 MFS transporter [Streptomyces sp. RKCA744]